MKKILNYVKNIFEHQSIRLKIRVTCIHIYIFFFLNKIHITISKLKENTLSLQLIDVSNGLHFFFRIR